MGSVVLQLQSDALDRNVPVSDLLRKALVVSKKLSIHDFEVWVTREISGYKDCTDIPEYRQMRGEVKGWNPYRGWIPVIFRDPNDAELLSKRALGQSVAEVESLLAGRNDDSYLQIPFPPDIEKKLSKGIQFETKVTLIVPYTGLVRILDAVRTIVLNWAMKLEQDGVLGEGLSFTKQEREAVQQQSYNIANFYGPVHGPQIQQARDNAIQVSIAFDVDSPSIEKFLNLLKDKLGKLSLSPDTDAELRAEVKTAEAQIQSPKPKPGIVKECLLSIRRILEGAGGGAAAQLLVELGKLLAS